MTTLLTIKETTLIRLASTTGTMHQGNHVTPTDPRNETEKKPAGPDYEARG